MPFSIAIFCLIENYNIEYNQNSKTNYIKREETMKTRVAVISIILENTQLALEVNNTISLYNDYIVGRMGIPYKKRKISIISVVVDAPQDIISTLSGKLGKLKGVSTKTAYSNYIFDDDANETNN